jgi:hypothetical protein
LSIASGSVAIARRKVASIHSSRLLRRSSSQWQLQLAVLTYGRCYTAPHWKLCHFTYRILKFYNSKVTSRLNVSIFNLPNTCGGCIIYLCSFGVLSCYTLPFNSSHFPDSATCLITALRCFNKLVI